MLARMKFAGAATMGISTLFSTLPAQMIQVLKCTNFYFDCKEEVFLLWCSLQQDNRLRGGAIYGYA